MTDPRMMHVTLVVGSTNQAKIAGARRAMLQRPDITHDIGVVGVSAASGVEEQPYSYDNTLEGAFNRAESLRRTYDSGQVSHPQSLIVLLLGLESGLAKVDSLTYVEFCAAYLQVYTPKGKPRVEGVYGLSSAWQVPDKLVPKNGEAMGDLVKGWGYEHIPTNGLGASGLLSGGLMPREEQVFEATRNALFSLYPRWRP